MHTTSFPLKFYIYLRRLWSVDCRFMFQFRDLRTATQGDNSVWQGKSSAMLEALYFRLPFETKAPCISTEATKICQCTLLSKSRGVSPWCLRFIPQVTYIVAIITLIPEESCVQIVCFVFIQQYYKSTLNWM